MLKGQLKFHHCLVAFARLFFILLLLNALFATHATAQTEPDYDEVSIYFNVQGLGNAEMPAAVRAEAAYLSIGDIFDFLKINNTLSPNRDEISGFFINEADKYLIDATHNRIRFRDKVYDLKPGDIIKTTTNIYLASGYFGKIFGLNCSFSFRNLSVILNTQLELPGMREMRLQQMRNSIGQLSGIAKADTEVKRTYPAVHFGTVDWAVNNTQDNYFGNDTHLNLGLGGLIAGGETDAFLNYNTNTPLLLRDQYVFWRLANNDNPALRQIIAGNIYGQSISSIYDPIVGIQLTNTPTTYRRSFGTYTISNTTQPNWVVELYVNNVLVNYVRADATGYYTFEVPLVYGNSQIKLRFYGPSGEERSSEENISIPFNFLPKGEFEYVASAGIVEDDFHSKFSRVSLNYGLTKYLTIGGGDEYLSSVSSGPNMPFAMASARMFNNLLLSGNYTYGVQTKAIATYQLPSGLQFEYDDTWYKQGQTAINVNFSEERKGIISATIRGKTFSAYTRLTVDDITLPITRYTTAEWLLSGAAGPINITANTYALFIQKNLPYYYTNLALSARIYKGILFTQQAQYEFGTNRFIGYKESLERRFLKNGYWDISYENNIAAHLKTTEVGLRYNFSFAQVGTSVIRNNYSTRYLQSASGSLVADGSANYFGMSDNTSVGKGAIKVVTFLDLNYNGKKDPGEPRIAGVRLRVNGGRIKTSIKDTSTTITELEPYVNYIVEVDTMSFSNIAWKLRRHALSVAIDPNKVKVIEVPVTIEGEVSGQVLFNEGGEPKGIGRIIVSFYRNNSTKQYARTITEADGYFNYLGLPPGEYIALPDSAQLKKLNLTSVPPLSKFTVKAGTDGSVIDGIGFTLIPAQKGATNKLPGGGNNSSFANNQAQYANGAGSDSVGNGKTVIVKNIANGVTQQNSNNATVDVTSNPGNANNPQSPAINKPVIGGNPAINNTSNAANTVTNNSASGNNTATTNTANGKNSVTSETKTNAPPGELTNKKSDRLNTTGQLLDDNNSVKVFPPFEYDITLQVSHFKYHNAKGVMDALCKKYNYNSIITPTRHHYYNIRITGVPNIDAANAMLKVVRRKGFPDAYMLARRRPPVPTGN